MIDPTRNKISTIFKSKNKDILGFKYNGGTDKVGLPHGQGKKEFIYDEKINYDWEMLKSTNHFDTQEFIYDLGVRIDENANYRNGTKHGKAYMNFRPIDHWEANVVFYCTFVKGVINGYALKQSIDEFRQHLVLYFMEGEIVHHFWNDDKSRDKHIKKLKNNDKWIYNIVNTELNYYFTDADIIHPNDRPWTNHKKFKLK